MRIWVASGLVLFLVVTCSANTNQRGNLGDSESDGMDEERTSSVAEMIQAGTSGMAAQGDVSRRRAPWIEVALEEATYREVWTAHVGEGSPPVVDFGASSVVFLLMGPQPTGGYWIDYESATVEDETLKITADLRQPAKGEMVTQAFTAPYVVLRVEDRAFMVVEWINEGRLLWRTEVER